MQKTDCGIETNARFFTSCSFPTRIHRKTLIEIAFMWHSGKFRCYAMALGRMQSDAQSRVQFRRAKYKPSLPNALLFLLITSWINELKIFALVCFLVPRIYSHFTVSNFRVTSSTTDFAYQNEDKTFRFFPDSHYGLSCITRFERWSMLLCRQIKSLIYCLRQNSEEEKTNTLNEYTNIVAYRNEDETLWALKVIQDSFHSYLFTIISGSFSDDSKS